MPTRPRAEQVAASEAGPKVPRYYHKDHERRRRATMETGTVIIPPRGSCLPFLVRSFDDSDLPEVNYSHITEKYEKLELNDAELVHFSTRFGRGYRDTISLDLEFDKKDPLAVPPNPDYDSERSTPLHRQRTNHLMGLGQHFGEYTWDTAESDSVPDLTDTGESASTSRKSTFQDGEMWSNHDTAVEGQPCIQPLCKPSTVQRAGTSSDAKNQRWELPPNYTLAFPEIDGPFAFREGDTTEGFAKGVEGGGETATRALDNQRTMLGAQDSANDDNTLDSYYDDETELEYETSSGDNESSFPSYQNSEIGESHPLFPAKRVIVQEFVRIFYICAHTCGSSESGRSHSTFNGGSSTSTTTPSTLTSPTSQKSGSVKRSGGGDDDEGRDDEEDGDDERSRKRPRKGSKGISTQLRPVACPFAKKDPLLYFRCVSKEFFESNRLKQHIRQKHSSPIHCPRCQEKFETEKELHTHAQSPRACEPKTMDVLPGLTQEQWKELGRRMPRSLSLEQRWYKIFYILFPDSDKPESAFIDIDMAYQAEIFRKVVLGADGQAIVRRCILDTGLPLSDSSRQQLLDDGIWAGIREIIQVHISRGSKNSTIDLGEPRRPETGPSGLEQTFQTQSSVETVPSLSPAQGRTRESVLKGPRQSVNLQSSLATGRTTGVLPCRLPESMDLTVLSSSSHYAPAHLTPQGSGANTVYSGTTSDLRAEWPFQERIAFSQHQSQPLTGATAFNSGASTSMVPQGRLSSQSACLMDDFPTYGDDYQDIQARQFCGESLGPVTHEELESASHNSHIYFSHFGTGTSLDGC